MPTQVPSGSALAVKGPARRRRSRPGPKLLSAVKGYADGGEVHGQNDVQDLADEEAIVASGNRHTELMNRVRRGHIRPRPTTVKEVVDGRKPERRGDEPVRPPPPPTGGVRG